MVDDRVLGCAAVAEDGLVVGEDPGRCCPLIFGRRGPHAALGPAARDLFRLPDPGLIGEPDLYGLAAGLLCRDRLQEGGEVS